MPVDTPEETKARVNLESREKKLEELRQNREKDLKTKKNISKEEEKKRSDEEAKYIQEIADFKAQLKPKKPEKIRLNLTSLHDLMQSIDKMAEFDRNLSYWGIIQNADFDQEDLALRHANKPYVCKLEELPPISNKMQYSTN